MRRPFFKRLMLVHGHLENLRTYQRPNIKMMTFGLIVWLLSLFAENEQVAQRKS